MGKGIKRSNLEKSIAEFCKKEVAPKRVFYNVRNILPYGREIDIYIPSLKLGIEVNGDLWHSNAATDYYYGESAEEYHSKKVEDAKEKGVELLFIWESDYIYHKRTVLRELRKALQKKEYDKEFFGRLVGPLDDRYDLDSVLDAEERQEIFLLKDFINVKMLDNDVWRIVVEDYILPRVGQSFVFRLNTGYIGYKLGVPEVVVEGVLKEAVSKKLLHRIGKKGFIVNPDFVVTSGRVDREGLEVF